VRLPPPAGRGRGEPHRAVHNSIDDSGLCSRKQTHVRQQRRALLCDIVIYITVTALLFDAIRPGDETPLYRQIVARVLDALATGKLAPGDRLESHRELAARLVVAPLTVKKAYDELERDGYLETRRGRGTFVRRGLDAGARAARADRLQESIARLCREAAAAGVPLDELVERLRAEAARLAEVAGERAEALTDTEGGRA